MKEKESSELHHRLEMVQDDVKALLKHLEDGKSMKEQTKYVDDGYTHLNQPFFEDPFSGKDLTMNRELTYNKWIKYIHDYQLNKNKKMKVKIMQRSVYHKYAEIEIEVPNLIDYESEIHDYLTNNEDLWADQMDAKFEESEYEFGSGVHDYEGMNESNSDSEWRFQCPNGYGGHL